MTSHTQLAKGHKFATASDYTGVDNSNWYLAGDAYIELINDACEDFGVTKYHLASLIGLRSIATMYKWTKGVQRPSSKYVARMMKLYQWQCRGVVVSQFDRVDWLSGQGITESKGRQSSGPVHIPETTRRKEASLVQPV